MEQQGVDLRSSRRKVIAALLLISLMIMLVRLIIAPLIASVSHRGIFSDRELSRSRGVYLMNSQLHFGDAGLGAPTNDGMEVGHAWQ